MLTALLLFSVTFAFIFLRAFQQLNVVHDKFWAVVPTSMFMSICDFTVIGLVAANHENPALIIPMGLGGGLGCMASMWSHKRTVRRKELSTESMREKTI